MDPQLLSAQEGFGGFAGVLEAVDLDGLVGGQPTVGAG
jgi:hypothetical protein